MGMKPRDDFSSVHTQHELYAGQTSFYERAILEGKTSLVDVPIPGQNHEMGGRLRQPCKGTCIPIVTHSDKKLCKAKSL